MQESQPARSRLRLSPLAYTWTFVSGAKETLEGFMAAIWDPAGAVSPRLKELVFLRSSIVNDCGRCWRSHLVSAKRRGLTDEQIGAIAEPTRWPQLFSQEEIIVLDLATALCRTGHDLDADLVKRAMRVFNDREVAEILLMAGLANMYNRVSEAAEQFYHGPVERPESS